MLWIMLFPIWKVLLLGNASKRLMTKATQVTKIEKIGCRGCVLVAIVGRALNRHALIAATATLNRSGTQGHIGANNLCFTTFMVEMTTSDHLKTFLSFATAPTVTTGDCTRKSVMCVNGMVINMKCMMGKILMMKT